MTFEASASGRPTPRLLSLGAVGPVARRKSTPVIRMSVHLNTRRLHGCLFVYTRVRLGQCGRVLGYAWRLMSKSAAVAGRRREDRSRWAFDARCLTISVDFADH